MNARIAKLIALTLTTTAIGCAATPVATTPAELPAIKDAPAVDQAGAEMCTIVRRGATDNVRDARIAEHWPNKNYGSATAGFAGNVADGARHTLVAFDLPEIPEGAVVTSAKLRLHKHVCGGSGVSLHRVTGAWTEETVTWNTFDGSYDAEPVAQLTAGSPESVSVDVTELAQSWASGAVENHGVVLTQGHSNTAFSTSEVEDASQRPTLEICWSNNG